MDTSEQREVVAEMPLERARLMKGGEALLPVAWRAAAL
jgi:hypothetical protein